MTETTGFVVSSSNRGLSNILAAQGIEFVMQIVTTLLIIFWILAIIWVAKDSGSRTHKLGFQMISIILVTLLTPILGIPIYLVLRPIAYKHDRLPWREAAVMNLIVCYNCGTLNPRDHEFCLACGEALKIKCKQCNKNYPHTYDYCQSCGAPNIE